MIFEIKHKLTGKLKFKIKTSSWKVAIETAISKKIDLRYANLSSADLRYANLSYADLRYADLSYANLRYANLRHADLSYANLRSANLSYANLDFSCWPLFCGSLKVKIDIKIKRQLLFHVLSVAPEYKTKKLVDEANKFHRVAIDKDVEKLKYK